MRIDFQPQRRSEMLEISRDRDVLFLNGERFDFSKLPVGATLPRSAVACKWLVSDVERDPDGVIHLALIWPHGFSGPSASEENRFPQPIRLEDPQ